MTTTVAPGPASMAAPFVSLKAMPFGWPPASLDTDSGRTPQATSGRPANNRNNKSQVSTVWGDCHSGVPPGSSKLDP